MIDQFKFENQCPFNSFGIIHRFRSETVCCCFTFFGGEILQHCFSGKLQKGFVDYIIPPDFPSLWLRADNDDDNSFKGELIL